MHREVDHPDAVIDKHTVIPQGKPPFSADAAAFREHVRRPGLRTAEDATETQLSGLAHARLD
jgi:hypothetical protein